jgi:hypothetical protein
MRAPSRRLGDWEAPEIRQHPVTVPNERADATDVPLY